MFIEPRKKEFQVGNYCFRIVEPVMKQLSTGKKDIDSFRQALILLSKCVYVKEDKEYRLVTLEELEKIPTSYIKKFNEVMDEFSEDL